MKVLFIDSTSTPYHGGSMGEKALGGIETATVELSRHLARLGHAVAVANAVAAPVEVAGVRWMPRAQARGETADVVIVNNDPRLFDEAPGAFRAGARAVTWLHNRLRVEKTIRKGHMGAFLRYRPEVVFVGDLHRRDTSRLHPFRRRIVIPLGVSGDFLAAPPLPAEPPPPPCAIFTSQAYRGLNDMIGLWIDRIRPAVPGAEFHVYTGKPEPVRGAEEIAAAGIVLHPRVAKPELVAALRASRVMLYPGHKDETFCLAAAEALCLGLPVATRGIGSLRERVRDGIDGLIAPDLDRLAEGVIAILRDDGLWTRLHAGAVARRADSGWDAVAQAWDAQVLRRR